MESTVSGSGRDHNNLSEIEHLQVQRLPEVQDKQVQHKKLLKVIILGDTGVGKSCILTRLTKDQFDTEHNVTVGVDFGSCCIKVDETYLKLQIWDTAGQESFRSITKIFYRAAHAVFLCYSINRRETFDNLTNWLQEVHEQCYPDVMVFLVGNKQDLESEREVSRDSALRFQREHNIKYFTETSAKSGDNVQSLFLDASKFLYLQDQKYTTEHGEQGENQSNSGSPTSFSGSRSNVSGSVNSGNGQQEHHHHHQSPLKRPQGTAKFGGAQQRPDTDVDNIVLQAQESNSQQEQPKKSCKC